MLLDGDRATTVFVSYSRADQKRALPVIKALEAAGLQVWWDGLLEGGDTFLPTTEAALENADAVVVLWSKTAVESHWVRDEATRGREKNRLVPVTIDGTHPPLGFRQLQTINLSAWHGKLAAPEFERAIRAINSVAGQAPTTPPPLPRQFALSRRAMIYGGSALLAGGAAVAGWKLIAPTVAEALTTSVAVLPFLNLSGDVDQAYFSDGISEQIRSTLSRNANLLVIAPTSITAVAKDGIANPKDVAKRLGVDYVLSGTVRRSGDQLRISATLNDGVTGASPWNEDFPRTMSDVFALQDEIADAVAAALAAQTTTGGKSAPGGPGGTSNLKAYDAFLRGNAFYALRSGEAAYRAALAQYEIAVREDPDYAAALAARAFTLTVITNSYGKANEFKAAYDDAIGTARRAVQLAPKLAIAHATLGHVLVRSKLDLRGAAAPFDTARKLGTGDAMVQSLCAIFAAGMGQLGEAEQAIARGIKLDPLNAGTLRIASFAALCARNWPLAIERARKALSLNPQLDGVHSRIGDALIQQGKYAEAKREYGLEPGTLERFTGEAIASARSGDAAGIKIATEKLLREFGDASTYQQAQIAAQSGQADQAVAKLLHAREIGDVGLALAYTDPMLDPLKGRPDFLQLLSDLGFG